MPRRDGSGPPQGGSRGRGRGRGGGRGMGMGPGRAFASSTPDLEPQPTPQPQPDSTQELAILKAQARALEEQLAALSQRVGQMQNATGRRMVAVVDADQCIGCGLCVHVCDAGAITVNGAAKIDVGKCTACGQCVAKCPRGAIALQKA